MRKTTVAAVAVLALLVAPPPSPVHLSYATSDSMEPVVSPGDGYVVVATGDYETGDVVTFYSERRGEYVTHRIVERTDDGYVTKGDANPSTDQAGGLPPVQREAILGELLVVAGVPVVIPHLGTAVAALAARPYLVAGLVVAAGLLALSGGRRSRTRTRSVVRVDELVQPVFAVGLFGTLVLLLLLSGTAYQFDYRTVEGPPQTAGELAVGEPANRTYRVTFTKSPLTRTVVETEGMAVTSRTRNGSVLTIDARLPPPEQGRTVETSIRTYAYPKTLPRSTQMTLHRVHPALATVVSVAVVFVPLYLVYLLLLEGWEPLRPPRARWWHRLGGDR